MSGLEGTFILSIFRHNLANLELLFLALIQALSFINQINHEYKTSTGMTSAMWRESSEKMQYKSATPLCSLVFRIKKPS